LKPPGFNLSAYEVKKRFQAFAFKRNLCRYTPVEETIAELLTQIPPEALKAGKAR
jgi:hypothetical protein